jgi:hypothetical protein
MNVEFRIAKLERLLTDVAQRRARVSAAAPRKASEQKASAACDSLERGFRTSLHSLEQQRGGPEIG